jgi:CheY-like chemotaxis protein
MLVRVMSFPSPQSLAGVRVLVLDDDSDSLQVLCFALELVGARVVCVTDTSEALQAVQSGQVDVVVSDLYMPREDGWSFIRRVRALPPHENGRIPAAVLTAHPSEDNRVRSLEAGFDTVVGKPIDPGALVAVVVDLMSRRR